MLDVVIAPSRTGDGDNDGAEVRVDAGVRLDEGADVGLGVGIKDGAGDGCGVGESNNPRFTPEVAVSVKVPEASAGDILRSLLSKPAILWSKILVPA